MKTRDDLVKTIAGILNSCSRESCSNTPDFILAEVMVQSLEVFERRTRARERWHGREVKDINGEN